MFEDNDISLWFTDAKCADCGALVTVPTPVDDNENNSDFDFYIWAILSLPPRLHLWNKAWAEGKATPFKRIKEDS